MRLLHFGSRGVFGGTESQPGDKDESEEEESQSGADAFAEAKGEVMDYDDGDDEVDEGDEVEDQPPAGFTYNLEQDIDVVERDNRGPSRFAGFFEKLPAAVEIKGDKDQHNNELERGHLT